MQQKGFAVLHYKIQYVDTVLSPYQRLICFFCSMFVRSIIRLEGVGCCGYAHLVIKFVSQTNLYSVHFSCCDHEFKDMLIDRWCTPYLTGNHVQHQQLMVRLYDNLTLNKLNIVSIGRALEASSECC